MDKLEKVSENPDLEAEMGKEWVISTCIHFQLIFKCNVLFLVQIYIALFQQ